MKFFMSAFLLIVFFVSVSFAAGDSLMAYFSYRMQSPNVVTAQKMPYNYGYTWSLSKSADYSVPSGVTIQLIKVRSGGKLCLKTYTDNDTLYPAAGDYEPLCVRKIFLSGTTADTITLYGNH